MSFNSLGPRQKIENSCTDDSGDNDDRCMAKKIDTIQYGESIQMLELMTGKVNHLNRANYEHRAREYNALCGMKTGFLPEKLGMEHWE